MCSTNDIGDEMKANKIANTLKLSRAEWLQARTAGLGSSDAATAIGVNQFKTPYQLYLEKIGEVDAPDLSNNDAVHFGNVLEEVIAQEYKRRTGSRVQRCNYILQHPEHDFMLANLDRIANRKDLGSPGVLEIKTTNARNAGKWGDQGGDVIPLHYLVQVVHQLAVTGFAWADVAVLIGGQDFRIYHVDRDEDLIAKVVERERAFWRCVETRSPPPPVTAEDVALMYPQDDGEAMKADEHLLDVVEQLRLAKETISSAEAEKDRLERELKIWLGKHSMLVGQDGKELLTWKTQTSRRLDQKRLMDEQPELVEQYMSESTTRVLRIKKGEGK